jgi:uncharacterized protein YndB with AHSA1/START domain
MAAMPLTFAYLRGQSRPRPLPREWHLAIDVDPALAGSSFCQRIVLFIGENVMPSTIRLHRVFAAPPERVYRAFLDPGAMCKWLPPNGFTGTVHEMDAKVGGRYRMSFTNFGTGNSHAFGGEYLELVPNERLKYSDRFEDPGLPGEMTTTVTLKKVSVGTEVQIVQEGVPDVIPAEACYLGWQESLALLKMVVEPEIPDGA